MIRRLLEWLFPDLRMHRIAWLKSCAFRDMLANANEHGLLTLQEVDGAGWRCSIRPAWRSGAQKHEAHYAWTGTGETFQEALASALGEANEYPVMKKLAGAPWAPKLVAKEFDDE